MPQRRLPKSNPARDDQSDLPLANVQVVLFNATVNEVQITATDGMFFMPVVPSGTYTLQASLVGYNTYTVSVNVVEGDVLEHNIRLVPTIIPTPPEP